jgi:glycosyltransferase involved in cell wall biosynthesis
MKIAFVWDDLGKYEWRDGLWAAMKYLENEYDVQYFIEDERAVKDYSPDIIFCWGPLDHRWDKFYSLKKPMFLFFAGGTVDHPNSGLFKTIFVESGAHEQYFNLVGVHCQRAFGTNDALFKPRPIEKKFDAIFPATYALWKRQELLADALGSKVLMCGPIQDTVEKDIIEKCWNNKAIAVGFIPPSTLSYFYNASSCCVVPTDRNGGSQRVVLEAMASGIPVITMVDQPLTSEFVSESENGAIIHPDPYEIVRAVKNVKSRKWDTRKYIESAWTAKHYYQSIKRGMG